MAMKISFVIPAHNEAGGIGSCIRSVLREIGSSGCEAEVIVVDNASTDDTAKVASSFPGVTVVHEPVKGTSMARQRGLKQSSGEIVACIDADTELPDGWIRTVLREFDTRKSMVCLSGPCIYHDLSAPARAVVFVWYVFAILFYGYVFQYVLRKGAMLQSGNHAVRRSVLQRAGGYNSLIAFHGDDADTAMRLARHGRVRFSFRLPIYTSGRRLRKEGIVRTGWTYALNAIFMMMYGRPYSRTHADIREGQGRSAAVHPETTKRVVPTKMSSQPIIITRALKAIHHLSVGLVQSQFRRTRP